MIFQSPEDVRTERPQDAVGVVPLCFIGYNMETSIELFLFTGRNFAEWNITKIFDNDLVAIRKSQVYA